MVDGCHFEDVFEQSHGKEHRCFYNFINENSLQKSRPSWHGWNPGPTQIYRQVSGFLMSAFLTRYDFLQPFFKNTNPKRISTEIHQPTKLRSWNCNRRGWHQPYGLYRVEGLNKINRLPETEKREIPVTSGLEVVDDIIGAMAPGAGPPKSRNRNLPGGETTSNTCSINTESGVQQFLFEIVWWIRTKLQNFLCNTL